MTNKPYDIGCFNPIVDCHWDGGAPTPGSGQLNIIWVWPGQGFTLFTQTTTYTGVCGNPAVIGDQGSQIIDGPNLTTSVGLGIYSGPTGNVALPTEIACPTDDPGFPKVPVFNGERIDLSTVQGGENSDPPDPAVTDITFQTVATINETTPSGPQSFTDAVIVNLAVLKFLGTGFFAPLDQGEVGRAARIQGMIQAELNALVQGGGQPPQTLIYQPPPDPGP